MRKSTCKTSILKASLTSTKFMQLWTSSRCKSEECLSTYLDAAEFFPCEHRLKNSLILGQHKLLKQLPLQLDLKMIWKSGMMNSLLISGGLITFKKKNSQNKRNLETFSYLEATMQVECSAGNSLTAILTMQLLLLKLNNSKELCFICQKQFFKEAFALLLGTISEI